MANPEFDSEDRTARSDYADRLAIATYFNVLKQENEGRLSLERYFAWSTLVSVSFLCFMLYISVAVLVGLLGYFFDSDYVHAVVAVAIVLFWWRRILYQNRYVRLVNQERPNTALHVRRARTMNAAVLTVFVLTVVLSLLLL